MAHLNRLNAMLLALLALLLLACTIPGGVALESARATLAPTGKLRVGLYRGSPSSIVEGASPADAKGVGFDLGRALASRLGVPFEPVVFPSNTGVLAAIAAGQVDITFTNASAERAQHMDFSQTFMDVEKSVLVPAGSPITALPDLRRPGIRIGVSAGSSTAEELRSLYPNAATVPMPTLADASQALAAGELDAFATNKAILFGMSDRLPGSRVVPGQWGMEHFAAAIPKGRLSSMRYIDQFISDARADGTVRDAIARANLRGAASPL